MFPEHRIHLYTSSKGSNMRIGTTGSAEVTQRYVPTRGHRICQDAASRSQFALVEAAAVRAEGVHAERHTVLLVCDRLEVGLVSVRQRVRQPEADADHDEIGYQRLSSPSEHANNKLGLLRPQRKI